MKTLGPESIFVILWIGSRLCALLMLGLLIWWAARNRQFRNMDQARRLPLKHPEVDISKSECRNPNNAIRCVR